MLTNTKLFSLADAPKTLHPTRIQNIDGLRGFLALSVVFFHGAIYHKYLQDGAWEGPPSNGYALLGTGGVAVFFMITGYLFWCRLIDEHRRPDWFRLYLGRFFRIGPLYLVAILVMSVLLMMQDGWQLRGTFADFMQDLMPWLALGLCDPTDLNHHPATLILTAGVTWSLRYEWLFYLALPALALAAGRGPVRAGVVFAALSAGLFWSYRGSPYFFSPGDPSYVTLFLIGIACAMADRNGWSARIRPGLASVAILLLMAALFLNCQIAYAPLAMGLLGICFYLIISGATLFGVLTHPAATRLGEISYGIYLLQGLVLAACFQNPPVRVFALASPLKHWFVVLGAMAVLVIMAFIGHIWVERPGILLGKRLARLFPARAIRDA